MGNLEAKHKEHKRELRRQKTHKHVQKMRLENEERAIICTIDDFKREGKARLITNEIKKLMIVRKKIARQEAMISRYDTIETATENAVDMHKEAKLLNETKTFLTSVNSKMPVSSVNRMVGTLEMQTDQQEMISELLGEAFQDEDESDSTEAFAEICNELGLMEMLEPQLREMPIAPFHDPKSIEDATKVRRHE